MSWLKTFSLLIVLTVLVVIAGGLAGGLPGLIMAGVFALLMNFFAFWFSDKMALRMAGAKEVTQQEQPRLHQQVAQVARLANLPMPRVFLIENDSPNAFATGRSPKKAVVAVTTGMQRLLNEEELKGVIAHEMAHVKNRDMLIMSIVAVLAGVIAFLAFMAQFALIFGGMGGRGRGGGGGYGAIIGIVGMLLLIFLMPMAASVVRFAISRTREYAADETGANILKNPLPLAAALEKLDNGIRRRPMKATSTNEAMAHMYIVNPLGARSQHSEEEGASRFVGLFSTHPPLEERVRKLRNMIMFS